MEKLTAFQKYYRKNREKRKGESLQYSKTHGYSSQKSYIEKHPEKRNSGTRKIKEAIYDILGRKCTRCGFDDPRALQIDHIKGNGSAERKLFCFTNYYKYILTDLIENPGKYQILCANCNWIKRIENKENRK